MPEIRINESGSVQFPMVRHAVEIGWTPLDPETAKAKRGGVGGMLLREELTAALTKFNPWLTPDAVRQILERLDAIPATMDGNLEMLLWLRGEKTVYDEGEERQRGVRLVDFSTPSANTMQVSWEWALKPAGRAKGNRADVLFVLNGIPVCLVEHKNPKDGKAIERAIGQLRRYEKETPELIGSAQLFNVTHLLDYWYGVTWNATRRDMARWKQTPDEAYRFAVQSFFEPTDLLRTLQHWILYYVQDSETRKSILREHQRRAIDAIVARCADPVKKRGLIWHTQGSGKTFTLLTAARLILEQKDRFKTPTVILVVDRTELEGQLKGWVDRMLGEMSGAEIPIRRANNKADLQDIFDSDFRGLVLAMIHKFEAIRPVSSTRDNIFVFIDEAHRSVARDLGSYLMAAVPNATVIGLTGTPIAQTDQGKGTFKIFGAEDEKGYLDKYSIKESIADETTLPIRHVLAPSEMTVPLERLDKEFFELAESEGVTDIVELNAVLDRAVGLRTFLKADDRIANVAAYIAKHFTENVDPLGLKAFVVAVDREACAKYKRALRTLLPPEWVEAVYTGNANDVVERPLVAELQLSEEREIDVRLSFKKAGKQPKILIVTDKLLTGYDAPVLYCMYLDKPMRDHVLLQAIARVNRPYVDADGNRKKIGLVIDFVGVLRELKKALKFDSEEMSGVIEDLDLLLQDLLARLGTASGEYLSVTGSGGADEQLETLVYERFLDPATRKAFFEAYKEIESLWEIVSPAKELVPHITTFKRLAQLYATVRNAYADQIGYVADLAQKTRQLVQQSAAQEGLGDVIRSVTFDVKTLEALRGAPGSDEGKVFNLVRGLQKEMDDHEEVAPVLQPLKERAERIIKDMENRNVTGLAALDLLATVAAEKEAAMQAARDAGLGQKAFSAYWGVVKESPELKAAGVDPLAFAKEIDRLMAQFPNAGASMDERRKFRSALYRPLITLPATDRAGIVDRVIDTVLPEEN